MANKRFVVKLSSEERKCLAWLEGSLCSHPKENIMPVSSPTPAQLQEIAAKMGLSLTENDIASFLTLMQPTIEAYNLVDRLPNPLPQVKYPRTPGYRPPPERTNIMRGTTKLTSKALIRASSKVKLSCSKTM